MQFRPAKRSGGFLQLRGESQDTHFSLSLSFFWSPTFLPSQAQTPGQPLPSEAGFAHFEQLVEQNLMCGPAALPGPFYAAWASAKVESGAMAQLPRCCACSTCWSTIDITSKYLRTTLPSEHGIHLLVKHDHYIYTNQFSEDQHWNQ